MGEDKGENNHETAPSIEEVPEEEQPAENREVIKNEGDPAQEDQEQPPQNGEEANGDENTEDQPQEDGDDEDDVPAETPKVDDPAGPAPSPVKRAKKDVEDVLMDIETVMKEAEILDPKVAEEMEYIKATEPTSRLEIALAEALKRKESHIDRLSGEVHKLKAFISKRKQTYKRKRKDEGAPTRALSAYNIFVQDRFAQLAKENEAALKSADSDVQLKRVPPANLVASTGNQWKGLAQEEKVKYEERAKQDRKRYEEQMAQYQPPDKQANRKRNKTGYNMFFSAHVLRLKQSECGVPSERGSVARLVGTAWKQLSAEEKQYYEREADKHNGMNPVEKDGDEEEDEDVKRQQQAPDPYAHMHPDHAMHMHGAMPPPMHGAMHQAPQHDPRHHGYAPYPPHHMYGQPTHGYYDYSQHHSQSRHQHGRSQYGQGYPPQQRHPYEQGM